MLINGIKFACNTCVKGHRSSACNHTERPLIEIRRKGRPITQCSYCRDLRKTKQVHIKCTCSYKKSKKYDCIENTATKQYNSLNQSPDASSLCFLEGLSKKDTRKSSIISFADNIPPSFVLPTPQQMMTEMVSDTSMEEMIHSEELDALLNNVLDVKVKQEVTIMQQHYVTPHSTCTGMNSNINGQSVVITITPISSLRGTVSRIVTCYCGDSCICPGCFVHPNNYDALFNQAVTQPCMPYSIPSSSCSSDDEDQQYLCQ